MIDASKEEDQIFNEYLKSERIALNSHPGNEENFLILVGSDAPSLEVDTEGYSP